jgi:hypothetical protein
MDKKEKLLLYRDRFFGRQDVFGRYWSSTTEDGGKKSGYAPKCANFWKDMCHLKNKTKVGCDSCEYKQYVAVSDDTLFAHITGNEVPQIQYVLQIDGTVKFGAVDFDLKPGKEDKGYGWDDVKKFIDVMDKWGIPCGVARSTTNGFHVYIFLEEFYAANKFRAIIWEAYERAGFMEYLRQNIKSIPEIFPKQSYISSSGLGNGIKTPIIIPQFAKERNGFVTKDNEWIGKGLDEKGMIEAQWDHLAAVPKATALQLDELIAKEAIEVHEDSAGASSRGASGPYSNLGGNGRSGGWQAPATGSIEKVLEGCAAFNKIKEKCAKGVTPSHDEGFALYHLAMKTADGIDWFTNNVPGWGKSESDMKQLEHSLKKDYAPWTCRTLQEKGICVVGTQCFKKKPPVETVEGQAVVRDDLPMDRWPEPSPVRYAFGAGDDFLRKLMKELDDLKEVKDKDELKKKLEAIAYRAQVFDDAQQKVLKTYIRDIKLARLGEVKEIFGGAADKANSETRSTVNKRTDVITVDDNLYKKRQPYGYSILKAIRSKEKEFTLCHIDILVTAVKTYIDEDRECEVNFHGVVKAQGVEKKFEISTARWADDKEFYLFFIALLGPDFNVMKANIPAIRQAAMGWSKKCGIENEAWFMTQGWYGAGKSYIMPSVIVDRDSIRPNTEKKIDLTRKSHAKYMDFTILDDATMRETLFHIKAELLNAWPRKWTTVCLGHSLLPVILGPLGNAFTQKPTLFFEGLTGSGKTALTKIMQCFWGPFDKILTLQSSAKGVIDVGYDFKDSLLVVDDYKGLSNEQTMAVKQAIQYSYGDDASVKMNRNQMQNKSKGVRSVLTMTGEQFLTSEASMVARCILIETDKQDTTKTQDFFVKCAGMKDKYCGVTPAFINYFLNLDKEVVREQFNVIFNRLHGMSSYLQNSSRLSYNLALNHLSYSLFVNFMQSQDILSHQESREHLAEHAQYVEELLWSMSARCEEEQNGFVFLRVLRQLIDSGQVAIRGIHRFDHAHKNVIGFAGAKRGQICFYPDLTWQATKNIKDISIPGDVRSIGRQLKSHGVLIDSDSDSRCQKTVKTPDGSRARVWVFDMTKLGYANEEASPVVFRPSDDVEQKLEGII